MSQMAREAAEAAAGARKQLVRLGPELAELARRLRAKPPSLVVTCARGSSDHAATYGKYLIETTVGSLVASVGPGVASAYARSPRGLGGALFIPVSQSGRSPDLLELTQAAKQNGALVVVLVNDEQSPLAKLGDLVLPLCAGEERAVAATKSYLLAGLAFLQLAAAWSGDAQLADIAARTPDCFDAACALDWSPALTSLARTKSLYVISRGIGLGAAAELALKLKETCGLHAEAFSAAELAHGPIALVDKDFPILALGQHDETEASVREVVGQLVGLGANVYSVLHVAGTQRLPSVSRAPAVIAPLLQVQSCYLALPKLAALRGLDADAPRNLQKVTKTR